MVVPPGYCNRRPPDRTRRDTTASPMRTVGVGRLAPLAWVAMSTDRPRPKDGLIVCGPCTKEEGRAHVLRCPTQASEVRCERCRRYYQVFTTQLGGPTRQQMRRDGRIEYRLLTRDGGDGLTRRSVVGTTGYKLLIGEWVTIVRLGGRVVGVANQTTQVWNPVPPPPSGGRYAPVWWAGLVAAGVLGVVYLLRGIDALGRAVADTPAAGGTIIALVALIGFTIAISGLRARSEKRTDPGSRL